MNDDSKDVMCHRPLPYVIVLRAYESEDTGAPVMTEHRVVAYSLVEAMFQAMMEAGGTGINDATKFKVQNIGPDLPAYLEMLRETLASTTRQGPGL